MEFQTASTVLNILHNISCQARERITVAGVVKSLTANLVTHTTYGPAFKVWIGVEGADIRKTMEGTDPVNTGGSEVGHIIFANERFAVLGNADIANFKALIKTAGETAVLEVEYYYGS
ncbi:MAG: hypothetical protein GY796_08170 [Chloroflexi bacterium]|nr:hypothetical protein [Chloroflexota bacterium]